MNTQQEVRVSYHNTHATKSFGICQRILQFQQECDVAPAGRFGFVDCRAMRQSITVEINRKLQSDHFKSSKDEIKKNLRLRWRPICSMADAWKQHQASKSERLAPIPTTSARNVMLQESIWIYVWVMCLEMSACIQTVKESTAVGTDKTRQTSSRIESQQVASTTWTLQAIGRQEVGTVMCRHTSRHGKMSRLWRRCGRTSWLTGFSDADSQLFLRPANPSAGCCRGCTGTTTIAGGG